MQDAKKATGNSQKIIGYSQKAELNSQKSACMGNSTKAKCEFQESWLQNPRKLERIANEVRRNCHEAMEESQKKYTVPKKLWEISKEQKGAPGMQKRIPLSSTQLLESIKEISKERQGFLESSWKFLESEGKLLGR